MLAGLRGSLSSCSKMSQTKSPLAPETTGSWSAGIVLGIGFIGFRTELREEVDETGAAGVHVGIVLDVVLGLVFRRELEVTGIEHLAPPVS